MEVKNNETVYVPGFRKILAFILLTFIFSIISAQESREEVPPIKERLFFGGSFSLQLGTITNIEVSPVVGLWVLPRLAVAAGPSYNYFKFGNVKTDIFGGRGYVQFVILRDLEKFIPLGTGTSIFLHLEDELLSLESVPWGNISVTTRRFIVNTVLSGPGVSQQMGRRASVNFMVLWALNDSGYEIYSTPEIRIGFVF
jgi:hypothetical protein